MTSLLHTTADLVYDCGQLLVQVKSFQAYRPDATLDGREDVLLMGFSDLRDQLTLHAIATDARYAVRVVQSLKNADPTVGAVAMLCIYNYLSLFVYESHKQLANIGRVYAENLIFSADAAEVIRRSRHSLKLFEDTRRGVDGQLRYFSETVIAGHRRKFIEGVRFPWAQFLATDLGIYTYSQIPVATTHSATFIIGATPDELFGEGGGLRQRQIAEEYGRYFGALTGGTITEAASFVTQMQGARLSNKDVRADRVYANSFNGESAPALNGLLSVFQSLLNTTNMLLPLDTAPVSWQTTLKMRFLTAYQVLSSLALLKEDGAALRRESLNCIDSMLRHLWHNALPPPL